MSKEIALKAIQDFDVREYVEEYEFRGDGDYMPNDQEKTLIEDAILGAVGIIEERIRSLSA